MQEKDRGDRLVGQPMVQTKLIEKENPCIYCVIHKHQIISRGSHAVMAMKK